MRGSQRFSSQRFLRRSMVSVMATTLVVASCGGDESAGGSIEDWCTFAKNAEDANSTFNSLDGADTDAVEAGLKQVESIAKGLPENAPSEIKDDAKELSDGTMRLVGEFEKADYNILDVDFSFMEDDDLNARMEAASDKIDAFTQRECGFGFSADDDDDSDVEMIDVSGGTLREQLVTQFETIGLSPEEAGCIADNLDFDDPAVQSGDIASMLDVFGTCDIGLDRLSELGAG